MKEYALYKGEEILAIGTVKEIAKETGLKTETVRYYHSPAYKKRCKDEFNNMVLVSLDDE